MDSVPFTLFFMVFLLGFQENMVRLYVVGNPIDQWPEECKGQNYCSVRPKDYPSDKDLTKLFLARKDLPPAPVSNETEHREGVTICRDYKVWAESIYMIKDEHDKIRYALNVPKVYSVKVETSPCHADQMLDEYENKIKCEQRYTDFPLLVLNEAHSQLQTSKVKLPTSCAPVHIWKEYDY